MGEPDDQELVRRCLSGDVDAFEPLVVRYEKVLYNVALRMVRDHEDARDVTQNTLVKAYEKLDTFDPQYRFFSWIYRIAVNECLNFLERHRAHQELDPRLASGDDPQGEVEARELSRSVEEALLKLSPEHRVIVILRHFLDLSYSEMSAVLPLPEKTVKSRLYAARQRLGALLSEQWSPVR